jgi:hypothetical protein
MSRPRQRRYTIEEVRALLRNLATMEKQLTADANARPTTSTTSAELAAFNSSAAAISARAFTYYAESSVLETYFKPSR